MKQILIFSGTTEGRRLAELLSSAGIPCHVCVATEYGSRVMEPHALIRVHEGRLNAEAMTKLYREITETEPGKTGIKKTEGLIVVDATHPYASEVSRTIRESLQGLSVEYIRLKRRTLPGTTAGSVYASAKECAEALLNTEGKILLTTGSKELSDFCEKKELVPRIIARVIPSVESLKKCEACGLAGRQIIAAQGPFSEETNIAAIHQYDIRHLVTKESGAVGGEDTKLSASKKTGVFVHLIGRPAEAEPAEADFETAVKRLSELLKRPVSDGRMDVCLVGIGCGGADTLTAAARKQIAASDYLFGAKRMLDAVNTGAEKYPFYRAEEIIPRLEEIREGRSTPVRVSILFSGDTGFYSGAEGLHEALLKKEIPHSILPGISSMAYFFSRLMLPWQDAAVVSTHGVEESVWKKELLGAVAAQKKVFFLTSGLADVKKIGEALTALDETAFRLVLGYRLSYEDERILSLAPTDCRALSEEGLYVGAVLPEKKEDGI